MTTPAAKTKGIPDDIQAAIDLIAPEIKGIVHNVENGTMSGTTQNNYGGYMSALSSLVPSEDPGNKLMFIITESMKQNGGNAAGIKSAAAVILGRDPIEALLNP